MKYSDEFEVVCNYTMPMIDGCNETDEQLNKHREEYGDEGYDASVNFQVFIGHKCIDFDFNLFGLDVRYTFMRTDSDEKRQKIYNIVETVNKWFKGKTLDSISEKMYYDIENELGKQLFNIYNA